MEKTPKFKVGDEVLIVEESNTRRGHTGKIIWTNDPVIPNQMTVYVLLNRLEEVLKFCYQINEKLQLVPQEHLLKYQTTSTNNKQQKCCSREEAATSCSNDRPYEKQKIRLELAKAAMQGILANSACYYSKRIEELAKDSVQYADALIKELNK